MECYAVAVDHIDAPCNGDAPLDGDALHRRDIDRNPNHTIDPKQGLNRP